jgi:hypothetical protein
MNKRHLRVAAHFQVAFFMVLAANAWVNRRCQDQLADGGNVETCGKCERPDDFDFLVQLALRAP